MQVDFTLLIILLRVCAACRRGGGGSAESEISSRRAPDQGGAEAEVIMVSGQLHQHVTSDPCLINSTPGARSNDADKREDPPSISIPCNTVIPLCKVLARRYLLISDTTDFLPADKSS